MDEESKELSEKTILRDREQGLKFLGTVSRDKSVRRIMVQNGYTKKDHKEGWDLLLYLLGYSSWEPEGEKPESTSPQDAAIATLDQFDGPTFERAWAAMEHLHKDQCDYLFSELWAATGTAAVASVKTFVDRVVALRDGTEPSRKKTRKEDKAAVETLEARGIFNAKIETWLRGLIEQATCLDMSPEPPPEPGDEEYMTKALAFHAWLKDWRTTARAVITRRDYLIRLGIVERRTNPVTGKEEVTSTDDSAATEEAPR
jgi:hypothetical protein